MPRPFAILDVLTISTGMLLSERHMEGVRDILNYMTGDQLYMHQIARAVEECRPVLLRRYPVLSDARMHHALEIFSEHIGDFDLYTTEMRPISEDFVTTVIRWRDNLIAGRFGFACPAQLMIAPLAQGDHEFIDPLSELVEFVHPDRIIVVRH